MGTAQTETALFMVYGLGWLIQMNFDERGMNKNKPKAKQSAVPSSAVPMCVLRKQEGNKAVTRVAGERLLPKYCRL